MEVSLYYKRLPRFINEELKICTEGKCKNVTKVMYIICMVFVYTYDILLI